MGRRLILRLILVIKKGGEDEGRGGREGKEGVGVMGRNLNGKVSIGTGTAREMD